MDKNKSYLYEVAVGFDKFINAVLFGRASETLSSRCYRNAQKYWYAKAMMYFLDFIFKPWDESHCKESYENCYAKGECPKAEVKAE